MRKQGLVAQHPRRHEHGHAIRVATGEQRSVLGGALMAIAPWI